MAHDNNRVVMAIFNSSVEMENAIDALRTEGFRNADISALLPSPDTTNEFAHVAGTKSPEGAAAGGTAGAIIGGALGWLAGIGSIAIPGLGPLIAIGPIMGLLAGIGAGGVVGGVTGALVGMGFPEYEARRYEAYVREGGFLISVHCDNEEWADKARAVLERSGAHDVSVSSEYSADSGARLREDVPRHTGPRI